MELAERHQGLVAPITACPELFRGFRHGGGGAARARVLAVPRGDPEPVLLVGKTEEERVVEVDGGKGVTRGRAGLGALRGHVGEFHQEARLRAVPKVPGG